MNKYHRYTNNTTTKRLPGKLTTAGLLTGVIAGALLQPALALDNAYFNQLKTEKVASNNNVEWQHFGPGMSGYIDKFWVNENNPNNLVMGLDMGNQFCSTDKGQSWTTVRDSDATGQEIDRLRGLDFATKNSNLAILSAGDGFYRSTDAGCSWNKLPEPTDASIRVKYNVVESDPNNNKVWYMAAGEHGQIKDLHYVDDGTNTGKVTLEYTSPWATNHSTGYIIKSINKGNSWDKITGNFQADTDFSDLVVNPNNSQQIFASSQYGLHRSNDGGNNWQRIRTNAIRDLEVFVHPTTGDFSLYVLEVTRYKKNASTQTIELVGGGVYRTTDGGNTWGNFTNNLAIDLNEINSWGYRDKFYWAMSKYFGDSKATLKSNYPNLPDEIYSQFIGLEVDPSNEFRVYLVHNYKADYAFPPGNIWMRKPNNGKWVTVAREGQYWITEKDKAYWQSRGNPLGMNTTFAHVHREHEEKDNTQSGPRLLSMDSQGNIYTAFAQQMMRSTDQGVTWNQIDDDETAPGNGHWVGRGDSNLPGETLSLDTGTPNKYLFGSGEHGIWRTTTDGDLVYPGAIAVEQLSGQSKSDDQATSISSIAVHPTNKNKIFKLIYRQKQAGKLGVSTDNGNTWNYSRTVINFPATGDVIRQQSLVIDPVTPKNMYLTVPSHVWTPHNQQHRIGNNGPATFNDYGIYRSTNNGNSWTLLNNSSVTQPIPSDKIIEQLAIDPSNPATIYAAVMRRGDNIGGLYKTTNRGNNWWRVGHLPSDIDGVNQVQVMNNGDLYVAAGTYADDNSTGGLWRKKSGGSWELLFDMPNVRQLAVAPNNHQVILLNVDRAEEHNDINPGAYVSTDGGSTWTKINYNMGQPDRIRSIAADPYNENYFWATTYGSGFWKIDVSSLNMTIPGTIQAEHFSDYADNGATNAGGAYRADEGVDIEKTTDTNGGYSVGWTQPGEWLEYQLNTKNTASYKVVGRFATPKTNSKINVWLNGVKVKSNVAIASTGGHQNWQNQVLFSGRNLTKGTNTLRIEVVTGGFNMNWFKFSTN